MKRWKNSYVNTEKIPGNDSMFEIKITDLHLMSKDQIKDIINCLSRLAEIEGGVNEPPSPSTAKTLDDNELDVAGVRWNPEIHSANRTKTTDGYWRTRRNSSKEDDSVEIPTPATEFDNFMQLVKEIRGDNQGAMKDILDVLKEYDITSVAQVASHTDKISEIMERLKEL